MPKHPEWNSGNAILDGYLDYWDKTIEKWFAGSCSDPHHGCGDDPFLPTLEKLTETVRNTFLANPGTASLSEQERKTKEKALFAVQPNLMPEPYWGDPANCSIVIANLNPGGGEDPDETTPKTRCEKAHRDAIKWFMGEVKTSGYWNVAKRAPVFLSADELSKLDATSDKSGWARFSCYNGWKWWYERGGRRQWAEHFCKDLAPETTRGLKPFAMELCGWHSANWTPQASNAVKRNRDDFDQYVLAPLFEAVRRSKAKLGICLGTDWNVIFRSRRLGLRNKYVGAIANAPDQMRQYSVFDIGENAMILVSWKRSFKFGVPYHDNWRFETELIRALRNQ